MFLLGGTNARVLNIEGAYPLRPPEIYTTISIHTIRIDMVV
uniref:Uncharacterized protein n=1 Tax=Anguilla anguilla TaxID=7936 RepID=A0A0E9WPG7_ANGAN